MLATHGSGVEAVDFYEADGGPLALPEPATGLAGTASEDSPGVFALEVPVDATELSPRRFVAVARAVTGNVAASAQVSVRRAEIPRIDALAAEPANLPYQGGTTRLTWTAVNATSRTLDPGGLDVTGCEEASPTDRASTWGRWRAPEGTPSASLRRSVERRT